VTLDTTERLEALSRRLEEAAERLRAGDVDPEEAKRLAGECADLAAEAAIELDRSSRGDSTDSPPGQEELL
jgi:hypothetical protein